MNSKNAPLFLPLIAMAFSVLSIMPLKGYSQDNWPSWRGADGSGVAYTGKIPMEFGESKNLVWKTELPGKGHSTPVVWEDMMFLTTAVSTGIVPEGVEKVPDEELRTGQTQYIHKYLVYAINRNNGEIIWETQVKEEYPLERTHSLGSWASNSPVTDGQNLYAYFGSRGLFCLDFDGKVLWEKDFGQMEKVRSFGEGSSPAIHGDKIIVLWDHEGQSFIAALNKTNGEEVWKNERDELTSWSTPFIVKSNGKMQVITSATNKVRSYDLADGKLIWECSGLTRNVIPNPVYADGQLYVMSGYRGNALLAIDLDKAKGDITGTDAIVWQHNENTPYTPCPVLMDGKLYFLRANNGTMTCLNAKDGTVFYTGQEIEGTGSIYSSPTGVDGKLILASDGIVNIVKAGEKFELLASNTLDDTFHASPVIIGDKLYLRGFNALYCFSEE
jgi:outer membrane protein assembly factor BamB